MSMQRSDLPRVPKLSPDVQRDAIDRMWRAWNRAEMRGQGPQLCPMSYVATFAEMLEAGLAATATHESCHDESCIDTPLKGRHTHPVKT